MTHPRRELRGVRIVTPTGPGPLRGRAMGQLRVIPRADVVVENDRVVAVTESREPAGEPSPLQGKVLLPGLIDCHTHACWAGDRLNEWEQKLAGKSYLDILAAGGGIMSTVRAVRAASERDLADTLADRLRLFARAGTTTVEVKSGYGLTTADELKMLRAIHLAAGRAEVDVRATALLGHALDPDQPDFVRRTIDETLPAVHAEFPAVPVDAFLEQSAWSRDDCLRLLRRARDLGHPVRLHADQFTSLGGIPLAIDLGARSVDHLEASTPEELARLAASTTIGVALPICGLHLDGRYANLRPLIDAGGAAAIATNCNPGSAPSLSLPLAVALAVRRGGLSLPEAITACTANAAAVLGLSDRGWIGPGALAHFTLLDAPDERTLAYWLAGPPAHAFVGDDFVGG